MTEIYHEIHAEIFHAVGHPLRVALCTQLLRHGPLCVNELWAALGIPQAVASHHLGILHDKGILGRKREGKNTRYTLDHPNAIAVLKALGYPSAQPQ